jgi:hypothetical protein
MDPIYQRLFPRLDKALKRFMDNGEEDLDKAVRIAALWHEWFEKKGDEE